MKYGGENRALRADLAATRREKIEPGEKAKQRASSTLGNPPRKGMGDGLGWGMG